MAARTEIWDTARHVLRDFGNKAELECDARITHMETAGDLFAANSWRHIRNVVGRLRRGEQRPPE